MATIFRKIIIVCLSLNTCLAKIDGQNVSKVWVPDLGNGMYKNPIINADYSDPDAIRVGSDYYMIASSFDQIPGLPILYSKDLVNWQLIGHALKRQPPFDHFSKTQHGNGVWAPAIRYHNNKFYIYYPDPDFGIYLTQSTSINGPWSDPELVVAGSGLIDPCPLWDTDGKVYLVHGFAGSRAGIKSVIAVKELSPDGKKAITEGSIVFDGHENDPTLEGPKFYKRNGYYYIFAPAGGVSTGWQLVLRSKNIYGPYERKVVMDEGSSGINGPHQGAWVNTITGEDWFLHFQDKDAFGRVVHLQPMIWKNDWPVIGEDKDGDGKGQSVLTNKKPNVGKVYYPITTPATSDEFDKIGLGLQWQWQANPQSTFAYTDAANGVLKLYTQKMPDSANNLWFVPNVLTQKFPADSFNVTTKLRFFPNSKLENEQVGLIILGKSYATLSLKSNKDKTLRLTYNECINADKANKENEIILISDLPQMQIYLSVNVHKGGVCKFYYSTDGIKYLPVSKAFQAVAGQWIGAKVGLFAVRDKQINDAGYADVDYFRIDNILKQ